MITVDPNEPRACVYIYLSSDRYYGGANLHYHKKYEDVVSERDDLTSRGRIVGNVAVLGLPISRSDAEGISAQATANGIPPVRIMGGELRPCPFCGGEAAVYHPMKTELWLASCSGPRCCYGPYRGTPEEAALAWNVRRDGPQRRRGMSENNGWISCSERMPEPGRSYLVAWGDQPENVSLMRLDDGKFLKKPRLRWERDGRNSPWTITHWMPLPNPPKVERANGTTPGRKP